VRQFTESAEGEPLEWRVAYSMPCSARSPRLRILSSHPKEVLFGLSDASEGYMPLSRHTAPDARPVALVQSIRWARRFGLA